MPDGLAEIRGGPGRHDNAMGGNQAKESFSFVLSYINEDGTREKLGKGTRNFAPKNVCVQTTTNWLRQKAMWNSFVLWGDFYLLIRIVRARRLTGFAIHVMNGSHHGFSFNWFYREGPLFTLRRTTQEGNVRFGKRSRSGVGELSKWVDVELDRRDGREELVALHFVEDYVLTHSDRTRPISRVMSHEVLISKGSVLRFVR
jgi:hypothetical protein